MGACFLCTEVEGFDSHTVHLNAPVAQRIEHSTSNARAVGSNPTGGISYMED